MLHRLVVVAFAFVMALPLSAEPLTRTGLDLGYADMYDLDFTAAHHVFEVWMGSHPDDPLGPASDAAAFLFSEFDRLGVLDIELFADEDRFTGRGRPQADPSVRQHFEDRINQSDALCKAALGRNPKDARALFAQTLLAGLHSDYAAMIDRKDYAALKYTEQASVLAQKTLAADPTLYDAQIAVGVENYMLSLKPAAIRFFLNLRGDRTSKEEGIRQLRLTSEKGHYLAPFARLMLAVAEVKDNHLDQARTLLTQLSREFPRNTLYSRQLSRLH